MNKILKQQEEEKWSRQLFWFIIGDTLLNKDKEYPEKGWQKRFFELEKEGFYNE